VVLAADSRAAMINLRNLFGDDSRNKRAVTRRRQWLSQNTWLSSKKAWRLENLDIVPDLNGADLLWADFSEANLSGANFQLTRNLSVGQLSEVKTLYEPKLDPDLMKQIERNYPHLLAKPESDK